MTAPLVALTMDLSYWETLIVVTLGGLVGVTVFYNFSHFFIERSAQKRAQKKEKLEKLGKYVPPKKFTRTNKFVIKTKKALGIWGIAFLTASFLSIPIGSIICAKFYRHNKYALLYLYVGIIICGALFTTITYLYQLI